MRSLENITVLKCLDHILRLASFFLEHPNVFLSRVFFLYIRERKLRQIGKRGSDFQDQEGQEGQKGGQNIFDKMIRNTEAAKHWLKE